MRPCNLLDTPVSVPPGVYVCGSSYGDADVFIDFIWNYGEACIQVNLLYSPDIYSKGFKSIR